MSLPFSVDGNRYNPDFSERNVKSSIKCLQSQFDQVRQQIQSVERRLRPKEDQPQQNQSPILNNSPLFSKKEDYKPHCSDHKAHFEESKEAIQEKQLSRLKSQFSESQAYLDQHQTHMIATWRINVESELQQLRTDHASTFEQMVELFSDQQEQIHALTQQVSFLHENLNQQIKSIEDLHDKLKLKLDNSIKSLEDRMSRLESESRIWNQALKQHVDKFEDEQEQLQRHVMQYTEIVDRLFEQQRQTSSSVDHLESISSDNSSSVRLLHEEIRALKQNFTWLVKRQSQSHTPDYSFSSPASYRGDQGVERLEGLHSLKQGNRRNQLLETHTDQNVNSIPKVQRRIRYNSNSQVDANSELLDYNEHKDLLHSSSIILRDLDADLAKSLNQKAYYDYS